MLIELHWADLDKTILCYTIIDHPSWKDFHDANKRCWEMIENAKHPINIILDVTQITRIPRNAHIHIPNALKSTPENLNIVVFVGLNVYTRSLKTKMEALFPHKFDKWRVAWTHAEAMQLIEDAKVHESV